MDADRLKKVPLFAGLTNKQREQIARWADVIDVSPGKHLVEQGEFPYEFIVIEEGTVAITRDGERLAELGAGDFFGEIALLEHDRRTASVVADTPLRAIVMHARDFAEMTREMPEVCEQISAEMRKRLGEG